ncbi:MAG: fibronectin type III domain-containing protein [Anaerovoracaceae bacterium]
MKRKLLQRILTGSAAFIVAAAMTLVPGAQAFASDSFQPGLVLMGEGVKGNTGFRGDVLMLSEDQIEKIKDDRSAAGYGIGDDAFKEDRVYSSYENHGGDTYHYSRAAGLDIKTMLENTVAGGTAQVQSFSVVARDGYGGTQLMSELGSLKYFAPGETDLTGTPSADPLLALFKSSMQTGDRAQGVVPDTAERLARGNAVLVFGQKSLKDNNNCHFVSGTDMIVVNKYPPAIMNDSGIFNYRLEMMINGGIVDRDYTFTDDGRTVTHKVRGVELADALRSMSLQSVLDEHQGYKLQLTDINGRLKTIQQSQIAGSVIAWAYSDGMATPAEQSGYYALYTPGSTKEESVFYDLARICVLSKSGQVVNDNISAPAAPAGLKAVYGGTGSLRISWQPSEAAEGYILYRYDSRSRSYKAIKKLPGSSTTSCSDSGLMPGTTYRYCVAAYRTAFGDTLEGAKSAACSGRAIIKAPTLKLKKKGRRAITIRWNRIQGANDYVISRAKKAHGRYRKIRTVRKGGTTKISDTKLRRGRRYYYKIRSYRKVSGKTAYSSWSPAKGIRR